MMKCMIRLWEEESKEIGKKNGVVSEFLFLYRPVIVLIGQSLCYCHVCT